MLYMDEGLSGFKEYQRSPISKISSNRKKIQTGKRREDRKVLLRNL